MKLSGLIIETSTVHSTKSARPLSIVKFVFLCENDQNLSHLPRHLPVAVPVPYDDGPALGLG